MNTFLSAALAAGTLVCATPALAQHEHHHNHDHETVPTAPISIMGDHIHDAGDWMLSYRYQRMDMNSNRNGIHDLSPEEIVTTVANPNAPPPTLRVVPTDMTMDMHMIGAMVGATDWLTLMVMGMYMEKEMDHITFAGMAGTTRRGTFSTKSSGWGDTSLSGLIKLYEDSAHNIHAQIGISAPTGSIKESDQVLAPTGAIPTLRLPYAMQLGSGTWDALPGLTYTGHHENWSWGAQYEGTFRLEDENDQGYALGNKHQINLWTGYQLTPWLQGSLRVSGESTGKIDGSDPLIAAPVQTANPDNYGGDIVETSLGFNITPTTPGFANHQIGIETTLPVYQDLNGPQMKRDWGITAGWIVRF